VMFMQQFCGINVIGELSLLVSSHR
jgi:hypothetical protein